MSRRKQKAAYVIIAGLSLAILSIWYVPKHTWRAISRDGYITEKGSSVGMVTWKLLEDSAIILESVHTYSSSEAARQAFEEIRKDSKASIECTKNAGETLESQERVVKVNSDSETREGAAQIIRIKGNEIWHIDAGSLKDALAFEKDWLKINF